MSTDDDGIDANRALWKIGQLVMTVDHYEQAVIASSAAVAELQARVAVQEEALALAAGLPPPPPAEPEPPAAPAAKPPRSRKRAARTDRKGRT